MFFAMKLFSIIIISVFTFCFVKAQNPISPPGTYIADPSAHVWRNGKLYIYGSLDESCDYYCSWRHHVMETEDMNNWKIHENVFSSKGENDQVPYTDKLLFAPDGAEAKDSFYLYYCMPDKQFAEGVASSDNPAGPFLHAENMDLGGHNQIDPSVFTDDDGQVYYLWGQFSLKMAKMKPNMRELDLTTLRDSIITEEEHFFHEGAYLTKRNGLYYLVYADISREEKPTCIGYATSKNPFGPYEYGGVIVDNDGCNPNNWNNHGSLEKFNNQWYVFYHRSTHGCVKMRKSCVEPVYFNEDGSIDEVEMTTQGASGPLNARHTLDAERACVLHGNVRIVQEDEKNEILAGINSGDKVFYKYLDFGEGVQKVRLRVRPHENGGTINLFLDQPWYQRIASYTIQAGEEKEWKEISFKVENASGIHALGMQFWGAENNMFDIDWIRFE
jgi:beta-xylosidase